MPESVTDLDEAIRTAFVYLSQTDALDAEPYDAVIGFGMFDLALPRFCGDLFMRGQARRIIFTGGIGAGTGDLGGPEADVWRRALAVSHPSIGDDALIIENRSTHTGENVAFTAALLARARPDSMFGHGIRRAILVASPTRLRRVWLTMRRQQPGVVVARQGPRTTLTEDAGLYAAQGIDYRRHIAGELDRIVTYPQHGWIVAEPLPEIVRAAHRAL